MPITNTKQPFPVTPAIRMLEMPWNPNGSMAAIEGITSPDGRVLGKMGHSERSVDSFIGCNIPGSTAQGLFQAGVDYFA